MSPNMTMSNYRGPSLLGLILPALILLIPAIVPAEANSAFTDGTNPLLTINLICFDAAQGDLQARLHLKLPSSELTSKFSPKQDFYLVDELTATESVLKILATNTYSAFNNELATAYEVDDAGSQFLYPFDVHHTELRIFVDRSTPSGEIRVPLRVDTTLCSFEGYKIAIKPGPDNAPDYVNYKVELHRTLPIRLFTMFLSVLMLTVALGFMLMVRKLLNSNAPPDINELAFGAALLFAFPAIRSTQPFVPPMGVLSDFLGFFWAETIVACSLIVYLTCWMRRKTHD